MPSPFDALADTTFATVATTFASMAIWGTYTGQVLFQEPSTEQRIGGVDYSPMSPSCEYMEEDFPGLRSAVALNDSIQTISIGSFSYHVREVEAIQDGRANKARLKRLS